MRRSELVNSLLVGFSAVTIGVAQIGYNLILQNRLYFPSHGLYFLYVIVGIHLLPLALVVAIDLLLKHRGGNGSFFRIWRAALYTLTLLSFGAQAILLAPSLQLPALGLPKAVRIAAALGVVASLIALILYAQRAWNLFFSYLGLLAAALTLLFVYQVGLLGPAWKSYRDDAPREKTLAARPPVFVIILDGVSYVTLLKDGIIDPQTFPNLSALAADSLWFTHAATNYRWTGESIPSLLSGRRRPEEEPSTQFPSNPAFDRVEPFPPLPMIFDMIDGYYHVDIFDDAGALVRRYWEAKCQEGIFYCRDENYIRVHHPLGAVKQAALAATQPLLERLFPPRFVAWFVGNVGSADHVLSIQGFEYFLDSVDGKSSGGEMYYWHPVLPHSPFDLNAEGRLNRSSHTLFYKGGDPEAAYANYVMQIQLMDRLIGRFVTKLKQEGLYEQSTIVLTADHGLRPPGWIDPEVMRK
ncbi:MAG: sulfatase-like hydrolase/transferase, partial [Chloroflexi bacterium]|nr:sulfatase-like hydrolase/transferase [Chloroflexota bacterium]